MSVLAKTICWKNNRENLKGILEKNIFFSRVRLESGEAERQVQSRPQGSARAAVQRRVQGA